MFSGRNLIFFFLLIFICSGMLLVQQCSPEQHGDDPEKTTASAENQFVGDVACKNCHRNEYNDWLQSDHYKAMLPANDSTVLGDFNDRTFSADGMTSHFFKKDGKFFINTQGEDGKNHDFEIKYTFGYYPLQQYLIEFPGGRMQATRDCWDTKNKKWFHQYAGQKIPAGDWLHWTGNAQNWNTMCAMCHSTNLQKNYDVATDSYHTTYSVINVSCEACHGAGKRHVDYINGDAYRKGTKVTGSYIGLGKDSSQTAQMNSCAPCHALSSRISAHLSASGELMDDYIPEIPSTDHYYADGQGNDEDYTYTSFSESKMFRRGVTCSNCHNPHSGKILLMANQVCLQCHAKTYDDPAHTFHTVGTDGAECKNCHMPGKFYMGNDFRYDHTFRVPRPDLSVQYGTPNACNNCHKDKSFQWAAAAVTKWYGTHRQYHFAEDLIPGSKLDSGSEGHLLHLLGDTATPDIIRATAAHYLGSIPDNASVNALLNCLQDRNAQTRYRALRSLENFPTSFWINAAAPLLSDSVRAVRIAAANLFIAVPLSQIPENYSSAFSKAKSELDESTRYQADFSVGAIMAGDYYLKQQDYANAEKYYMLGLKKDRSANYARLNLSVVYNATGRNTAALQVLQDALKVDPANDRVYFNLGLLYNEMNDGANALRNFRKAVDLHSKDPRVYYDYGLLLEKTKDTVAALKAFQKGLQLNATDADLNYALALLYLQTGQVNKARSPAAVLRQYYSDRPEYRQLLQHLGM